MRTYFLVINCSIFLTIIPVVMKLIKSSVKPSFQNLYTGCLTVQINLFQHCSRSLNYLSPMDDALSCFSMWLLSYSLQCCGSVSFRYGFKRPKYIGSGFWFSLSTLSIFYSFFLPSAPPPPFFKINKSSGYRYYEWLVLVKWLFKILGTLAMLLDSMKLDFWSTFLVHSVTCSSSSLQMDIRYHETKWSLSKTHEGDLSTYFIDQWPVPPS